MNRIISALMIPILMITFSSCKAETEKDFNELIKALNSAYDYDFKYEDFTIEKRENIIYHIMTDNGSLLSFYSNKEKKIIQCTLSGFNINNEENSKIFSDIGKILCKQDSPEFKEMFDKAKTNGRCVENGWNIAIIKNDDFSTYLINRANSKINSNQLPTLKKQPDNNR